MENIDNWEVISDEQMGAYLSDKRDSINISGFDDGIDARYSYETEVEKKDYRDYFGKIQHHYQDLKRNPLSTFSRGAWNGLLDLPRGLGDAIIGAGEYVAFKTVGGDPEFDKRLAEGANALRAKNAEWFKQYEYVTDQKDNQFISDLGRAGGSLVSALGLSFITRNPTAVAGAFGVSQFGNINKELRERGVDIDRSLAISTGLGIAEGALERIGLHLWFENAATKKISSYLIKQGATEFTQEASQTAVEEVSMKLLGERDTEWWDIAKDVIYTGVIGGIVGVGGGAASIPSTEAFKKQAKDRLVEKGFTEEKAQQLVDDAAYSNEEARRDLLELVNKEADQSTLLNGSYEDDVKAFNEIMQKDIVAEAFDIKQQLKETAMTEGGLDEETAEVASTLVENFTKVMYNETGQTPLEQFEEQGLTIIDERYPSPQDEVINESELTEEEIARLDAREKEEFDIPFQTDQLRPGDEGYYQSDDKNLVAVHKISAENLNKAMDIGGFPSPSIAIIKGEQGFEDFGDITLVGSRYTISPTRKTDVYNRDVWTKTFPLVEYKKVTKQAKNKFVKKFEKYFNKIEDKSSLSSILYTADGAVPSRAVGEFENSDAAKVAYIEIEQKEDINIPKKDLSFENLNDELNGLVADEKFIEEISKIDSNFSFAEDKDKIALSINNLIDRTDFTYGGKYYEDADDIKQSIKDYFFDENGDLYFPKADKTVRAVHRYLREKGKETVDLSELRKYLNDKIKDKNKYSEWVRKQIEENLVGEPKVRVGNSLLPWTLDNITKSMISGATKNSQDSLIYGGGKVIAAGAKKLNSIEEIKIESDKLVSKEESDEKVNTLLKDMEVFTDKFSQDYNFSSSMLRKEAAYKALGKVAGKVYPKESDLISALHYELNEKTEYPKELIDVGMDIVKSVKNLSRYYFEAKPQRNVGINEFDGAIIPTDSKFDDIAKKVESSGLRVVRSDNQKQALQEFNDVFFQTAYHGGADFNEFSLKNAGKATGLEHGYGVYATLSREAATRYRSQTSSDFTINGRSVTNIYDNLLRNNEYEKAQILEDLLLKLDTSLLEEELYDENAWDWFKKEIEPNIKSEGKLYEVDIPDNPYLIDEQKPFYDQSDFVQDAIKKLNHPKINELSLKTINGETIYNVLVDSFLGDDGGKNAIVKAQKQASELLESVGIKGITYYSRDDGVDFVIFNPKDVKIIQKYYQGRTVRRGSYNPTTQVITLFKEANPSTIIHELGHFFTMKYVKALEETGQQEKLAGFYNWLGINSIDEATTETWEKMARGFETYALEGVAPNASTESVFQRMKQWLIGVYQDLKGKVIPPEEINDDVRAFFDGMLATEQTPVDVSNIKGRTDDLINIINAAIKGEEVSIDGINIKDVQNLIKASNARLPRLPKNLEQAIRAAGGIDIQLAKSLGLYDERKGNMSGFFKEGGAFDREDSLIEFLRDEGFLSAPESITYEQTAEITDRAINLLENASQIFRERDLGTVQQRESLIEAAQEASRLLEKIDYKEVQQAINTLRDKSVTAVQNETLKYIKSRLSRIDKDYRKVMNNSLRSLRKDIAQKQTDIINYIKEQPISNEHKFRLINEVKKTNSEETYEKAVNEVQRRAAGYYEQEQKKLLATQIKKEIKKSKPVKATQQRYDYETNKLFQTLREYNKFTQVVASAELENFIGLEEPTNVDLIKMRFLNYKANGMSSSTQLMEQVLNDILEAKRLGTLLKDQADMEAAINKEQLKQEVIAELEKSTADEDKFRTRFTNLYRRGFANLYSLINSISSRKLAERFEMETVLNSADVTYYRHTDNLTKKVMGIFGVKSRGDLLNKFSDLGEKVDTIYAQDGKRYKISKLEIIDMYNAIKNDKTRENYLAAYGEEQVMRFVNTLNTQERLFADLLMEDINSLYPETNKIYVETYGMDLKKVENYWPASSDHIKETDLLGDFYRQQETPSFYKERVKGRVTPLPKNAWEKYLKHVNESIYMIKVARKYKELSDTFKSSRVRNLIENKYGKGVYKELMEQINSISLNSKSESLNYVESVFGSMLNNFVVAKIAVAPTVFAGQLTSITNYSEEVNTAEYYKNFAYGLAHPKEVIGFMKKHAGDFLETRYKGGYSEALSRVQREAESAAKRKYKILSDKTKYNVTNALTSFVRLGDLGSLMFGGYAQIQTNLNSGMGLAEAIKKFEFDTLRSQQSSNAASLSSFQKSTGFSRVLLAFKNTQHQYFRKIVDSIIQVQRGEITPQQCAKTILNYAVIQGSLYIIAKNAVKAVMGLGDDDDELTDGLLEQLVVGNLDAIPFLSDVAHYAYKKAAGEYTHGLLSMPGLDDIERAIMKLYKEDKDVYDWVDVVAPLIEGTTATPVKRYAGMLKKYTEDE